MAGDADHRDNVVRDGRVADSTADDPLVAGVRQFNAMLAAEPRIHADDLQTVEQGYDGWQSLW